MDAADAATTPPGRSGVVGHGVVPPREGHDPADHTDRLPAASLPHANADGSADPGPRGYVPVDGLPIEVATADEATVITPPADDQGAAETDEAAGGPPSSDSSGSAGAQPWAGVAGQGQVGPSIWRSTKSHL